ncbi:hypothetical protein ES708_27249 [subsurface metagenome]
MIALSPLVTRAHFIIDIDIGDTVTYNVVTSSETTNAFWGSWPPGTYFGDWSVSASDNVSYTILGDIDTDYVGNIQLGNYTFENVRDVDLASGLVISIYPWNGGFFANFSDWDSIESSVVSANTTIENKNDYNLVINGEQHTFNAKIFHVQNYYGQYSDLYYDTTTGLFLNGTSSFGNYSLSLVLSKTTFEVELISVKAYLDFQLILITLPVLIILKKRFQKFK